MRLNRSSTAGLGESLADVIGAGALGAGFGVSSWLLGLGVLIVGAAAVAGCLIGWLAMRTVPASAVSALPEFGVTHYDPEATFEEDDALLLDERTAEPDAMLEPEPESRVTQLFPAEPAVAAEPAGTATAAAQEQTPGEMQARIAEHLAGAAAADGQARNSDSLMAAWIAKRRESQMTPLAPSTPSAGMPAPLSASRIAAYLSGEPEPVVGAVTPPPPAPPATPLPAVGAANPLPPSAPVDASDQLHAALDELRRTLRRG